MIRRICGYPGCDEFAEDGKTRCAEHQAQKRKDAAKRWHATQDKVSRRLYGRAWWLRESKRFLQKHPLCVHCAELGIVTKAVEVDHKIPHRGCERLFRDRNNWQPLCKACHSRKTASETLNRSD